MERQIHIRLSERKHALLRQVSRAREEAVSVLVRRAIDRLLEEYQRELPRSVDPDGPRDSRR